eukprot:m.474228 g.474228  ORF g.474228 m.474228 type:complete len:642 (+) comp20390_c5_seq2:169-2094(+)
MPGPFETPGASGHATDAEAESCADPTAHNPWLGNMSLAPCPTNLFASFLGSEKANKASPVERSNGYCRSGGYRFDGQSNLLEQLPSCTTAACILIAACAASVLARPCGIGLVVCALVLVIGLWHLSQREIKTDSVSTLPDRRREDFRAAHAASCMHSHDEGQSIEHRHPDGSWSDGRKLKQQYPSQTLPAETAAPPAACSAPAAAEQGDVPAPKQDAEARPAAAPSTGDLAMPNVAPPTGDLARHNAAPATDHLATPTSISALDAAQQGNMSVFKQVFGPSSDQACSNMPSGKVKTPAPIRDTTVVDNKRSLPLGSPLFAKWIDQEDDQGNTPLLLAAHHGHVGLVQWLITLAHVKANQADHHGNTALHKAAAQGHTELAVWLGQNQQGRVSVWRQNDQGRSALLVAAKAGHVGVLEGLISRTKASVHEVDNNRNTPLVLAACEGHLDAVKYLVEDEDAAFTQANHNGNTALLQAARCGHLHIVRWLVQSAGPQLLRRQANAMGDTAMLLAMRHGHRHVATWILEQAPDAIKDRNQYGSSPLLVAADSGQLSTIIWLLDNQGRLPCSRQGQARPNRAATRCQQRPPRHGQVVAAVCSARRFAARDCGRGRLRAPHCFVAGGCRGPPSHRPVADQERWGFCP